MDKSLVTSNLSPLKASDLTDSGKVAAVAWTCVREMFPVANTESDYSVKLRLKLMAQIVDEIGQDRFMLALEKAISISQRRYDVSIQRIRECAGLRYVAPPTAVALAWEFVMKVWVEHCRTDENGNYRLENKYLKTTSPNGDSFSAIPPPEIPPAIKRALRSLGGWAAIAEAWPEYIGQKYNQFKEFYREDDLSPRMDPGSALEKVNENSKFKDVREV